MYYRHPTTAAMEVAAAVMATVAPVRVAMADMVDMGPTVVVAMAVMVQVTARVNVCGLAICLDLYKKACAIDLHRLFFGEGEKAGRACETGLAQLLGHKLRLRLHIAVLCLHQLQFACTAGVGQLQQLKHAGSGALQRQFGRATLAKVLAVVRRK